jgi:large repetitive protein
LQGTPYSGSDAFVRLRRCVLGAILAFTVSACGSVGVSSGPANTADGITGPASQSANSPPVISGNPAANVVAGQTYSFVPTASDSDGDSLSFTIANQPDWASFDSTTGQLSGTPSAASIGTSANIVISVTDGTTSVSLPAFSITVLATLSISGTPPTGVAVGAGYSFQPTTNATGGTVLTFTVQNKPAWTTFDGTTGTLSGTPTQAGTYSNIVISVSDGTQSSSLAAFQITVTGSSGTGGPPTISGTPATSVKVGTLYSFVPAASDPAGNRLTFSIQGLPSWAGFSTSTGALTGTPSASDVGTDTNIVISVSDGSQSSSLPAFSIRVVAPLSISGSPATQVTAGTAYSFTPTTSGSSGGLTFSVQNRPAWASFSAATGTLSGTPTGSQTGTSSGIVISVSDGTQTASLAPFSIKVVGSLTISGNPPTKATAGSNYTFQPTTNAPSGTALTFSVQNQPAWASFSSSTGALSGTPTASQVGTNSNIVISVSNGTQQASLPAFTITVSKASGPTISGQPATAVNVGSLYSFTPTASDPNAGTLTFSIQNPPVWASFNKSTGALQGTPAAANAGTYANIVISVSDGTASASLPAFGITVNQVSNGSATLTWTPVTQNTNGSVLTDLAGYKVHYGTSANAMSTVVVLSNPSLTTYLVTNLSPGTWYFGVSAYASDGTQSAMSNVGAKTIN